MYTIEWPPVAYKMMAWFQSTFKFEIMQMPGSFPLPHTNAEGTTLVPCDAENDVSKWNRVVLVCHALNTITLTPPDAPGTMLRESKPGTCAQA